MRKIFSVASLATSVLTLAACVSEPADDPLDPNPTAANNDNGTPNNGSPNPTTTSGLASRYPGDQGIAADEAVIWYEDFEQGSVDELADRYDSAKREGLSFSPDVPAASGGGQSVVMSAGGAEGNATDLFKLFPGGHDQLYVRYYVKHEDAPYHHSGMWMGGYNPETPWPNPQAGERPGGDDRVSVAVEANGTGTNGRRLDFYNYWRGMHTWKAPGEPTGSGSWYGNCAVHENDVYTRPGEWLCVEFMVKLNDDPNSAAGGELALWQNDQLVNHYTSDGPLGYWIRDKFCTVEADAASCLDYAPPEGERAQEPLDLQWRTSTDLRLNWVWPQNYITEGSGQIQYDDMVVATSRIGCIQ